jgi:hypothetical protein
MIFDDKTEISYAILLYIFIIILSFSCKPPMFFNEDGKMKLWGIGEEKTLFPIFIIALIISILFFSIQIIMHS